MTNQFWEDLFDGAHTTNDNLADDDGLTIDKIMESRNRLKAILPPRREIWLSEFVPEKDKDGNKIVYIEMEAESDLPNGPILHIPHNLLHRGYLPETEKVMIMSYAIFERFKDEILASGIPVFESGGRRIQ